MSKPRLIAFYLPQFHPIPENDAWWGKGFTEWTNAARARPLFRGHYQPHLPADLGFYDLRLPEARQAQADLAQEFGLGGFCYYHYWFNGRQLLERPFAEVLASGKPDFPFCLCWANESWTRTWDGQYGKPLIQQTYSPDDDLNHIRALLPALSDHRYIRVDDKPLLLVYRAGELPDPRRTAGIWRAEARRAGLGDLLLCRVESNFEAERSHPDSIGFDAAVEFQPDGLSIGSPLRSSPAWRYARKLGLAARIYGDHRIYNYADVVSRMLAKADAPYRRFPCVAPNWDNSARRKKSALIFRWSSPELYEHWLSSVVRRQAARGDDGIVFVNAWNEWAEGCHLEPDLKHGRAYLQATQRAMHNA